MIYLYWLGALLVLVPLILGLPFLIRNRTYRVATLFAGMNTGIVTLSFFIDFLRWGAGSSYAEELHTFLTSSFPSVYIASLIVGSTIARKYYLNAPTRFRSAVAALGCLLSVYLIPIASRTVAIFSRAISEGYSSLEALSEAVDYLLFTVTRPDPFALIVIFVSTFIALNGTAAAMRISDRVERSKDKTE